jgi:predicted N-acetyltransferase YhbS
MSEREDHLNLAIEVFARAFARIRSRTYPMPAVQKGDFWILADQPHRSKARAAELITTNLIPKHHTKVGSRLSCPRYQTCLILTSDQELEILPQFKKEGFRRIIIEPFYTLDPTQAILKTDPRVQRVKTEDLAESVRLANQGRSQIDPDLLKIDNAAARLYAATQDNQVIGWVTSHRIENKGNWVSNLYVRPEFRNQKLGSALMSALLIDDARLGVPLSVLTASNLGTHLYPKLGYNQIATLHVHRPPNYPAKPRELCL